MANLASDIVWHCDPRWRLSLIATVPEPVSTIENLLLYMEAYSLAALSGPFLTQFSIPHFYLINFDYSSGSQPLSLSIS